jgi:hypothetical protein
MYKAYNHSPIHPCGGDVLKHNNFSLFSEFQLHITFEGHNFLQTNLFTEIMWYAYSIYAQAAHVKHSLFSSVVLCNDELSTYTSFMSTA